MTIVIKSNVVADDPNNTLPIYTEYGVVQPEVNIFINNLKSEGYVAREDDIKALEEFVRTLKDNELWNKTLEIYPLVGKDVVSAGFKLKSATSSVRMQAVSYFDNTNLDIVGGHVEGKSRTQTLNGGYNTGLQAKNLVGGFGLHIYTEELMPVSVGGYPTNAALWGATGVTDASEGTFVAAIGGSSTNVEFRIAYRSGVLKAQVETAGGGVLQVTSDSSGNKKILLKGALKYSGRTGINPAARNDRNLYLFARNGYGANEDAIGHYYPKVKFAMLTDGTLTNTENEIIRVAINKLIESQNRKIA